MATYLIGGPRVWEGMRDSEGYRTYKVQHLVYADGLDGPANVMQTAGLPLVGSFWAFGLDLDVYAWCRPDMAVKSLAAPNRPGYWFSVDQTFSNKPVPPRQQRCNDTQIEDPLLEPAKVSGSCNKYQEEVAQNYDGTSILNSAWEVIRGPQVEFDKSRPSIRIEQNVATFYEAATLPNALIDYVNDSTMWGFSSRKVKLSSYAWDRQFYGSCYVYYKRTLEFEVRGDALGFDRIVLDEGTKVLHGEWSAADGSWNVTDIPRSDGLTEVANYLNPAHFIRFRDRSGELSKVVLNGRGRPMDVENTGTYDDTAGSIYVRYYPQGNLLSLGVPIIF